MVLDLVDELLSNLDSVITALEQCGELRWAEWMKCARWDLRAGDAHGLDTIIAAYGAAGSFDEVGYAAADLVVGERIAELRTSIYEQASQLRREVRSAD